jgi:hypothetical protein
MKVICVGSFETLPKVAVSFVMAVSVYEIIRLPRDEFSLNLILKDFSKICRENSSFIKKWQEERVIYMMTHVHLW